MPIPYTRDAVKALRHAERTNTPASEILELFGWDVPTLTRICRRHEIALVDARGCAAASALQGATPPPVISPHDAILSRLTKRQAEIFRALQPHADGRWFTAAVIGQRIGIKTRAWSIRDSVKGLRRRLERMEAEYQIEDRPGPHGGFRLVTEKAQP